MKAAPNATAASRDFAVEEIIVCSDPTRLEVLAEPAFERKAASNPRIG
jgi:hypothetical protein